MSTRQWESKYRKAAELAPVIWKKADLQNKRKLENILINAHQKIVSDIIQQEVGYVSREDKEDVSQKIKSSLIRTLEKFDPTRGVKFSSFWAWQIRAILDKWWRKESSVVNPRWNHNRKFWEILPYDYLSNTLSEFDFEQENLNFQSKKFFDWIDEPRIKKIFFYRYKHELTYRDIGKALELSCERVRQLHDRTINEYQAHLKHKGVQYASRKITQPAKKKD